MTIVASSIAPTLFIEGNSIYFRSGCLIKYAGLNQSFGDISWVIENDFAFGLDSKP
jgi:hypothetical protein